MNSIPHVLPKGVSMAMAADGGEDGALPVVAAVFVAVVSDSASITAARDFSDAPPAPASAPAAAAAYALLVYLVRGSPYRRLCPPRGAAQLDRLYA